MQTNAELRILPDKVRTPAFRCITPVNIAGTSSYRLMLVLRTNGCAYDLNKKGCSMCDFAAHAISPAKSRVTSTQLLAQFDHSVQAAKSITPFVQQIDLLSLGSILHNWEVSAEARSALFGRIGAMSHIRKVVIESRAEYVTQGELARLRGLLREDQTLELGLGVETLNSYIRNTVLNKNLSMNQIYRVIDCCANTGVEFQAYLLIKPPGFSEAQAIDDAIESAEGIALLSRQAGINYRIAFEPVFVTDRTPLGQLYKTGDYTLVNLWSVIEILIRTSTLGIRFVGLSDENLSSGRTPRGCELCTDSLINAIQFFNGTQDHSALSQLSCICQNNRQA